ncbi:MAG TPA: TIGR00282 family metallophosphoesterase [Candidatus Omnitrophica bacterium]|nr:TIGR00282 family metallophosphoesterase [Candidatus Omnitrophota bacterium]
MKVLFIGDIVGSPGRKIIKDELAYLRKQESVDFAVANAENAASGSGLTAGITEELLSYHLDCLTTGDHIWAKKDVLNIIDKEPRLLRPANYPDGVPGSGSVILPAASGVKVAVLNLQGRVFMNAIECPFKAGLQEIEILKKETNLIIVDIHAEATSEKQALGLWLDGKVSAVLGTHTHVQTADERVLPGGTAFISDVGMTGPFESVLGRNIDSVLRRFLTSIPVRMEVAESDLRIEGVVIDIDKDTGKALSIKRLEHKAG